jgi:hypothetical protein
MAMALAPLAAAFCPMAMAPSALATALVPIEIVFEATVHDHFAPSAKKMQKDHNDKVSFSDCSFTRHSEEDIVL